MFLLLFALKMGVQELDLQTVAHDATSGSNIGELGPHQTTSLCEDRGPAVTTAGGFVIFFLLFQTLLRCSSIIIGYLILKCLTQLVRILSQHNHCQF